MKILLCLIAIYSSGAAIYCAERQWDERSSLINQRPVEREAELYKAILYDNFDTAKELLESGVNANASYKLEGTALILAIRNGNSKMVDLLIQYGADVNKSVPVKLIFPLINAGTYHQMSPLLAVKFLLEPTWHEIERLLVSEGAQIPNDQEKYFPREQVRSFLRTWF